MVIIRVGITTEARILAGIHVGDKNGYCTIHDIPNVVPTYTWEWIGIQIQFKDIQLKSNKIYTPIQSDPNN